MTCFLSVVCSVFPLLRQDDDPGQHLQGQRRLCPVSVPRAGRRRPGGGRLLLPLQHLCSPGHGDARDPRQHGHADVRGERRRKEAKQNKTKQNSDALMKREDLSHRVSETLAGFFCLSLAEVIAKRCSSRVFLFFFAQPLVQVLPGRSLEVVCRVG